MILRCPQVLALLTRLMMSTASIASTLMVPASLHAQSVEVSGLVGYTPSVDLEKESPQLDEVAMRGGLTWGVQGGWLFGDRWSVEGLWMRHRSALEVGTSAGTADLFELKADHVHGNVLFHFGDEEAPLRPFLLAGAGAAIFSADDLQHETKLSFGFGGGVKYFVGRTVGVRAHFRYRPTLLDDEASAPFCDPFGFCQNWLRQIEVMAGAVVRF